ncbi:MAG: hypothetical protein KAT38_13290 [Bacteroidales bacterium]|nr:hypothetical protein [Bacteroidales bacterium]
MEKTDKTKLKKRDKGRGKDTLYRVTLRNQINLISIADQKANIIIGINAVIISLLIAILGSGFGIIGSGLFEITSLPVPLIILMLFCLASAIFSIISARPVKPRTKQEGIMYSSNIDTMDIDEYLNSLNEIFESKDAFYANLNIDMYYQGKSMNRKFKLLRIAYTIFLTGLIISVVTFLIVFFTG